MKRAVLGLALTPLLALAGPIAAASDDVIWLRVEVRDQGGEHSKVKVNLPLSLVELVIDSVDKREFMANIESEHPSLDIPRLWREVRKMEGDDFVSVETDNERIRVWKDHDFFRVNVKEADYSEPNIEVKIPLEIMDYLFESKDKTFGFQEMVERVRGHLPLTLVQVRHENEHVRIWLEEE